MRKYSIVAIALIGFLLRTAGAIAQISLSKNNTAKPEYKYKFDKIKFNYSDLFYAGADTVWDISDAVFTGDTTTIHYTQDTAFDPFPNCGMTTELHDYLNNLDNSFIQDNGFVYQITDTAYMIAYEKRSDQYTTCFVLENKSYPIMTFPFEYGSVNDKPVNMEEKHVVWKREGDAWGTLICPDTTYQNVLRIKTTDSIHYQPVPNHPSSAGGNSVTYQWYTVDSEVPVLSLAYYYSYYWWDDLNYLSRDTVAKLFKAKEYIPIDTSGPVTVPRHEIVVYPNPATNTITIEGNDSISEVIIYNTFGQAVLRITEFIAAKNVTIDISILSKGVYVVSGKFTTGGKFRKRIVVTKE